MKHKDNSKSEPEKKPEPEVKATDDAAGAASAPPVPPVVQEDKSRKELEERLLRLHADFDNFRKRVMKERAEIYKRANEDLMLELLGVLDNLQAALAAAVTHNAPKAFADGFQSVADQLTGALSRFGLEPIDAAGKQFDPNEQEAISHMPSNTVPENSIITQTRRGYRLAGFLLRPAQVGYQADNPLRQPRPGRKTGRRKIWLRNRIITNCSA